MAASEEIAGAAEKIPDAWDPHGVFFFGEYDAWVHDETGLRVSIAESARPDQMHDARTSRTDRGYVARVQGAFNANLSRELATKPEAYRAAIGFMAAYPDGDFDVPAPDAGGSGLPGDPIDWDPDPSEA